VVERGVIRVYYTDCIAAVDTGLGNNLASICLIYGSLIGRGVPLTRDISVTLVLSAHLMALIEDDIVQSGKYHCWAVPMSVTPVTPNPSGVLGGSLALFRGQCYLGLSRREICYN
jgi:hypothetical protein